jgi:hypothetical protein
LCRDDFSSVIWPISAIFLWNKNSKSGKIQSEKDFIQYSNTPCFQQRIRVARINLPWVTEINWKTKSLLKVNTRTQVQNKGWFWLKYKITENIWNHLHPFQKV